ncbi:MAG: hypothetical protein JJT94_01210 [Bernardetiaceae bacterium]|nr:hypothetical protein [Bernardetiaceae bacterium]
MKLQLLLWCLSVLFFGSCTSWKNNLVSNGNPNDAVYNAIIDFVNIEKKYVKQDSVFSIYVEDINKNILSVSIFRKINKVSLFTKDEINYDYRHFPTNFLEIDGKLFYWKDTTKSVSQEVVDKLYLMSRVDTVIYQKKLSERIIDDAQKGVDYYFCKSDLTQYRKVRTSTAVGGYNTPKINCKEFQ